MEVAPSQPVAALGPEATSENDRGGLLRFITCGSVDDGKSTLIGRMLYDAGAVPDDQIASLARDSERMGHVEGGLDFSLLLDGLSAEREQGITIDVAYRYFATPRRKFIVADAPGHEQYTRNMVTGASTADAAIILVDARKGVLSQTRRHLYLNALLGVRDVVVAVNKMDLVDWSQERFETILAELTAYTKPLGFQSVTGVPVSARSGANVAMRTDVIDWYQGPSIIEHLEQLPVDRNSGTDAFRMPVQWVNRAGQDFRGLSGQIASGRIKPGDAIQIMPSGHTSHVKSIVTADGLLASAETGQAVTLTLVGDHDVSRGDLLSASDQRPEVADQFETTIVWMDEAPMLPGRSYLMKMATRTVPASIVALKHKIDVNTRETQPAKRLMMNEIGICDVATDTALPFEPYRTNKILGGFILIDRISNRTVAAGTIHFALRRSQNIHWQDMCVDGAARAALKGQRGRIIWLTGLSGAGKSTIADRLDKRLHADGRHTYVLDGDNIRHGLNRDLGFTDEDRVENIRRVAEVARLMVDAGLIVIVSLISPFKAERQMARAMVDAGQFIEVFVNTPLVVAERRDPKGLYRKARKGLLPNFTGISSPYEVPEDPEITVETTAMEPEDIADLIATYLSNHAVSAHGVS